MSNPFIEALEQKQRGRETTRSEAIGRVTQISEFLNSEEGVAWLIDKVRDKDIGSELSQFSLGHTTGVVLDPSLISDTLPRFPELDLKIILEGKNAKVSQVHFAERVDVYFPKIIDEEFYFDRADEEYQKRAIAAAMEKAVGEYPRIAEKKDDYCCVIFTAQKASRKNPYGCFIGRVFSPEELVDKITPLGAERLFDGFMKVVEEQNL